MLVKAKTKGFYDGIKREGDIFEVPDNFVLGTWTEKVEVASEAPVKKPKKVKSQEF